MAYPQEVLEDQCSMLIPDAVDMYSLLKDAEATLSDPLE
jgi:hypothetical protein